MEALERIKEAINNGKTTELNDWLDIARDYNISGNDDVEFIRSIENFVTENFSFETNTEAAYVYFGSDGNANIWQCVDCICKDTNQSASYITSTQAGRLFNDKGLQRCTKGT